MAQLGFFDLERTEAPVKKSRTGAPTRFDCDSCGLYRTHIISPKMEPFGDGRKDIMVIGEGPGEEEDRLGKQWQGKTGQILQASARRAGIDLFRDCITLNAVNCRPTEPAKLRELKNRTPEAFEIACCWPMKVLPAIEKYKPKVIVLVGYPALQSVVGHRFGMKDIDPISKWTGYTIPDRRFNAWLCPVFHPSYIARAKDDAMRTIWDRDLRNAFAMREREVPEFTEEEEYVKIIKSEDDIESVLRNLLDNAREILFDLETTGLKPYNVDDHEIISWSISSMDEDEAFSFMHPKSEKNITLLKKLLRHPRIGKIAWNMKFEHVWCLTKMGVEVKPWSHDPMQMVHIRDNRSGICGLDFQAFVRFGRIPWDREVKEYKESRSKNKNSTNHLREFIQRNPEENARKVLMYGGLDNVMTKMLVHDQRKSDKPKLYDLVHQGALALADAEMAGIRVDKEAARESLKIIENKIAFFVKKAKEGPVFAALEKRYGSRANLGSGDQLAKVLFEDLRYKTNKMTESGARGSTDEEVLERLHLPDLDLYLKAKKYEKIKNTYLEGFLREAGTDGFVHPSFSLHIARSGRSSSEGPNFQNVPIRDPIAQRICRGVLFPRFGRRIFELDYAGIEVRVAACICKDPRLIEYVTNPATDMHRDMAIEIFKWTKEFNKSDKLLKHLRYAAKNGFVFPEFYGSYYEQVADGLATHVELPHEGGWEKHQGVEIPGGMKLGEHMISQGIKSYEDFVHHLEDVEHDFWYKRFKVYTAWKESWWDKYQKRGYIETVTGFPSVDVLKRNEALNRPIQGAAFHCLLWLYVELWKIQKEREWDSRMMGQIHDSILFDAATEEIPEIVETVRMLTKRLREEWSWIIVPLETEFEVCPVDAPWSEKSEWKEAA